MIEHVVGKPFNPNFLLLIDFSFFSFYVVLTNEYFNFTEKKGTRSLMSVRTGTGLKN